MANLVTNPSFDAGITGWTSSDASEMAWDAEVGHTAVGSMRLTTSNNLATTRSTKFSALPNRKYSLSAWVKSTLPTSFRVQQYRNASTSTVPNYPHWVGSRGGEDWEHVTGEFVTALDVYQIQAYWLLQENGTAALDDVDVELLDAETPFALGAGAGVTLAGSPSLMGMKVLYAAVASNVLRVVTTGAEFVLDATAGTFTGTQTIGGSRQRFSCQLPSAADLTILSQNVDRVVLTCSAYDLAVQGDSMAILALPAGAQAVVTRVFTGTFQGYSAGFLTEIDSLGGVAVFPGYQRGTGLLPAAVTEGAGSPPATLTYTFTAGSRLALAVFPPRPHDTLRSLTDQIIHSDYYPPTASIKAWRALGNVLVLHENIWLGNAPKTYHQYLPRNDSEFRRVIADAHAVGMSVAPYFSPDFFALQDGPAFIAELARLRDEYGFDSVYFDGLNAYHWEQAYEVMALTRGLFPSGTIYLHLSYGIPFRKDNYTVFLPQVEAFADWLLKGESTTMNEWSDPLLNYVVKPNTVSGSIGTWKYDSFKVGGATQSLGAILGGTLDIGIRQRMLAYPTGTYPSQSWPTVSTIKSGWDAYLARLALIDIGRFADDPRQFRRLLHYSALSHVRPGAHSADALPLLLLPM